MVLLICAFFRVCILRMMALRAKNEAFNVEMATQHADVSAVTLSVSSDPQEQQRKQQSAHSLLASHPGLVISSQNSVENPTVSVSLVDSTDSSHERHMKQFVHNMLESRRSSVVSDEKYEKILSYLRDPDNTKLSPQFKFWVTKERQMSLTHQEENGETREVLTCCVPDCKKEHKQFDGISTLTIIPERDLYRTVKEIHEERLNHSGYKKVMDYVELRYYGLPRTYIQEFCKTCPACRDKSLHLRRRGKTTLKSRSPHKKRCFKQEVIVAENIQAAVDSISMDTSGNFQTVVIEVQNTDEPFDVSALAQPAIAEAVQPEPTPLVESDFMGRVQVDLIDMSAAPDGEFHHICHVMDYFSKYHILFPVKDRTPQELATGLQERVLAYFGPPRIIHSDMGRSFVHKALPRVVEQWPGNITFITGKPVSQPMQELVEQASQALEVELDAIKQELQLQEGDVFHWAQYLPRVMFKLNSQKPSPTMDTPYGVVFRQQPKTTLLPGLGSRIIGESQLERLIVSLTGTQS